MEPLTAHPADATTTWVVQLPDTRPIRVLRSLDGGSTYSALATLSEAWTGATFDDTDVPLTSFPLYAYELGE